MLTGDIREHALLFIYGSGENGKSVFLNTIRRILGGYGRTAPMDMFTAARGERHPTDLAMLHGARLVCATETEEGRAWAEAMIKQITGGDKIAARFMRQDFFEYSPQFKLMFLGNNMPTLKSADVSTRRRFNIVPFAHKPAAPDRQLEVKLQTEWPAILRWMIQGCLEWQANGLQRPGVVIEATDAYFDAQDRFGRWLAERCLVRPNLQSQPGVLLADCRRWAEANGEDPLTGPVFRNAMEKVAGVRYVKVHGHQWIKGINLGPWRTPNGDEGGGG